MTSATTIPLTVTTEAADRVAELGYQAELDRMLEYTRHVVTGVQALEVFLVPPYDTGDEPGIIIQATCDPAARDVNDPVERRWDDWTIATFAPDVYRHFVLFIVDGTHHGG